MNMNTHGIQAKILGLGFVRWGGVQFLLHPHCDTHQDREDTDGEDRKERFWSRGGPWQYAKQVQEGCGIGCGQVGQPPDERRVAQFNGDKDNLVEREEDRDLQQDWQTARCWVHLFFFVELHHGLPAWLDGRPPCFSFIFSISG